ncbi:MAG: hypothetical protein WCW26_02710 [Candidatus Buchananbacteria bacterium]
MNKKIIKKYLLIFSLGLIFFLGTSLFSYSDICCMFSASRYYGWPYPYLSLNKTVETLAEANQVKTLPVWQLITQGWQFHFGGDMLNSSPLGGIGNLAFDLALSFGSTALLVWLGKKYLLKK